MHVLTDGSLNVEQSYSLKHFEGSCTFMFISHSCNIGLQQARGSCESLHHNVATAACKLNLESSVHTVPWSPIEHLLLEREWPC
jgi:hypothetical protein